MTQIYSLFQYLLVLQMSDFFFYLTLGWQHIINVDATDHLLFVVVLTVRYSFALWRELLTLITAFTIGHSLTLALSVMQVFSMPQPLVEMIIPFTIVVTAFLNFVYPEKSSRQQLISYVTALVFGFFHGMGFAGAVKFSLASEQNLAIPLFGFNTGLELGQLVLVLLLLLIGWAVKELFRLNFTYYVWILSLLAMLAGFQMIVSRF